VFLRHLGGVFFWIQYSIELVCAALIRQKLVADVLLAKKNEVEMPC
jgi:hypothetical protein